MLIISGITASFFVLLGVVFFCGKGSALIAGYNTPALMRKRNTMKRPFAVLWAA